MKISRYKIVNVALLLIVAGVYLGINIFWYTICDPATCTLYFIEKWLDPLYRGSLALIPTFTLLLFFPDKVFKYWLIGIFSWTLPLSIYSISQVDIYSSSVLTIQASEWATILFGLIYFFTMICIFIGYGYLFYKKMIPKKELVRLLLFIPAVAVWYFFYY